VAVRAYLLILGSREGLAWVLENKSMAFREGNASRAQRLEPGDRLFLYTTRGAFGNPTRDRGRIIGEAEVASNVKRRDKAVSIGGKPFTHDCRIVLRSLTPLHEGIELRPLINELEVFPNPDAYSAKLRRPLLALPATDAELIRTRLKTRTRDPEETRSGYLRLHVARSSASRAASARYTTS
jgi:predicted RNA-binding protein